MSIHSAALARLEKALRQALVVASSEEVMRRIALLMAMREWPDYEEE
jgi:hypothetical protein